MPTLTNDELQNLSLTKLINYLTADIDNIGDKEWIKPALVSHVLNYSRLKPRVIEIAVDTYFSNPSKYIKFGW